MPRPSAGPRAWVGAPVPRCFCSRGAAAAAASRHDREIPCLWRGWWDVGAVVIVRVKAVPVRQQPIHHPHDPLRVRVVVVLGCMGSHRGVRDYGPRRVPGTKEAKKAAGITHQGWYLVPICGPPQDPHWPRVCKCSHAQKHMASINVAGASDGDRAGKRQSRGKIKCR